VAAHRKVLVWGCSALSCAKTAEPIEMQFEIGLLSGMGSGKYVLNGGADAAMGRDTGCLTD